MTGNRELLPEDVLVDLLGSGDFPAQVLTPRLRPGSSCGGCSTQALR
jgi:hypothetical protein